MNEIGVRVFFLLFGEMKSCACARKARDSPLFYVVIIHGTLHHLSICVKKIQYLPYHPEQGSSLPAVGFISNGHRRYKARGKVSGPGKPADPAELFPLEDASGV